MKYRAIYVVGPVEAATLKEAMKVFPARIECQDEIGEIAVVLEKVEYLLPEVWVPTTPEQEKGK